MLDDGENIYANEVVAITTLDRESVSRTMWKNSSGPIMRPIASLSFALNHYFAGGFESTRPFKLTNLTIHMINAGLCYWLVFLLLCSPRLDNQLTLNQKHGLSAIVALFWSVHPLQLTNILYVVQRMNSLAATSVLVGLILFLHGRLALKHVNVRDVSLMGIGLLAGSIVGTGFKENALLLPIMALVVELSLFQRDVLPGKTRTLLFWIYALTLAVPILILCVVISTNSDFLFGGYSIRHFTMWERLLTEARVLWYYIGLIFFPIPQHLGLFHDDIAISASITSPITTTLSVMGWMAIVFWATKCRHRYPLFLYAVLWFLAGHAMESTVLPLEIAYEHRNYLPSLGPIFSAAFLLFVGLKGRTPVLAILAVGICGVLVFITWSRAHTWSDLTVLAQQTIRYHPQSPRANDFAARVSLNKGHDLVSAIRYTRNGVRLAPHESGFHLDLHILLAVLAAEISQNLPSKDRPCATARQADIRVYPRSAPFISTCRENRYRIIDPSFPPDQVRGLLATGPITVHTVVAVDNLRRCITIPPHTCAPLTDDAIDWTTAAAHNSRTSSDHRAIVASAAAVLYASVDDLDSAYRYMSLASLLLPDKLSYRITAAEYLIKLCRLNTADKLIFELHEQHKKTSLRFDADDKDIRRLRDLHDRARGGLDCHAETDRTTP